MASTCPGANDDVQALINYYGRKQYFGHVQAICDHVLKGYESDNRDRARFWRCIAVIQQGESTPDIISDLHSVRNITYMSLAAIAALVSASKRADMDSVAELKQQLKAASKTKNAEMLVFAANFFWLIGKHQQARQCLERVLGDNPNNTGALTLMAWVNLTSEVPDLSQATLTYLNQAFTVLGDSPKPVDVLLGRAKWYELNCRTTNADESINMVLAAEAWFRPALIEKAQIQLMMRMPEDAAENVQKILKKDPANADAQLLFVTHLLSRVPDDPRILTAIQDLVSTIRRVEPTNANLYFKVSCLLSRLAFGNKSILDIAYSCIGQASSINPTNSEIRTEQAYQIFLKNDVASALQLYSEASQLDESKTGALNGMIRCKLFRGQLDDAAHELDFLEEIQGQKDTNRRSESAVELMALKGMLLKRRGSDKAMATELFTSAIKAHRERLGDLRLTPEYLISYNPDFILNAVEDILDLSGSCPREEGDPPRPALTFVGNVLVDVAEIIPGIVRPHLLLARTLYFDGLFSQAQTQIGACLRLDQRLIEPRLLRAQIEVQQQNWSEIADALDDIVSLNFEVRHTPLFHIVKVQLLEAQGQTNEALALIQSAMNLPGVRHKSSRAVVAESERVTLFLLSARLHARQMLSPEATKLLQDARSEFEASPEYDRILITDAELATSCRKDADGALRMLQKVQTTSPYMSRARLAIANIYLEHKKDRREYIRCFKEMAAAVPSVHTLQLLGDAYIRIQESQKAIGAFEQALDLSVQTGGPLDPAIYSRIGTALVVCHDYERAIAYYSKTIAEKIRGEQTLSLSVDLSRLLFNLKRFDESERILRAALVPFGEISVAACEDVSDVTSLALLIDRVMALLLLADISNHQHRTQDEHDALLCAYALQKRVLDVQRMSGSQTAIEQQKTRAGTIACQLASLMKRLKMTDKIEFFYSEAIRLCPVHEEALLALATMKLNTGAVIECQAHLTALLAASPKHVKAQLMLADAKFKQNEQEGAIQYFKTLLQADATDFHALDKLVQCLKRSGQLGDVHRYIAATQNACNSGKTMNHPGYHFIQGMVNLYERKVRDAIHHLNLARTDPEWAQRSLCEMIGIYLNQEYQELFSIKISERIEAAGHLLTDLESRIAEGDDSGRFRLQVLRAYAIMAAKDTNKINQIVPQLVEMIQTDRDYIPAYLALAHAFLELKEAPKARNQLKIIAGMTPGNAYADEFERSWLMLAEMYISSGSVDLAQKLARKTLEHSRSSAKAWELLGEIMTMEGSFQDAAQYFENSWQCHRETSSSVGFKLAVSYQKANRHIDAIEVAHKILNKNPDCRQLKADVIDKCRSCLRV